MAACANAEARWPRGLTELNELDRVLIKQKTSMKTKYRILAPDGREIMFAKEDCTLLRAVFVGKKRAFHMDMLDADNVEVMSLRRPYTFGPDKMDVTVGNQLASVVRQEMTFLKPVLNINDPHDRPVMRIKGPIGTTGQADFNIFDLSKNKIGVIRKMWGGLAKEMFTDADNFEIVFPPNLDVRYKAALIGACLLINFLFYEH